MIGATQIVSSLYQERGEEVTLLSCWLKADVRRVAVSIVPGGRGSCRTKAKLGRSLSLPLKSQAGSFQPAARLNEKPGRVSIASAARFRKTCLRKTCRRRNGITVIIMVMVLGGLAIALLTLAGQTSIQMKSIQNASLDTQQCNELIALGEKLLTAGLLANPEFSNEIIRVDLPQSFVVANPPRPQIGIVELTMIAKSDTDTDARHGWTIHASFGASEGLLKHATKTVYLKTEKK